MKTLQFQSYFVLIQNFSDTENGKIKKKLYTLSLMFVKLDRVSFRSVFYPSEILTEIFILIDFPGVGANVSGDLKKMHFY